MHDRAIDEYFAKFEPPEGLRAELLRRDILLTGGTDIVHNRIVTRVMEGIDRGPWQRLGTQHLSIPGELSKPQPDLVVCKSGACEGAGWLVPASAVMLLLEVVSKVSAHRDYGVKRSIYAAGGIPAYLIVDPFAARCLLLTEPTGAGEDTDYQVERTATFGTDIPVDVLGLTLETGEFPTQPDGRKVSSPAR
ncbi:Uma2 family endonuclease [Streptomyces sioyaensis]|uniref:Uma2 family endonuclease n=1 Tax=Streptomyces sioyaensis TaxID=67364 RepID=UPI0037A56016